MSAEMSNDIAPDHLAKWHAVTREYLFATSLDASIDGNRKEESYRIEEGLPYPSSHGRNTRSMLLSWAFRALLHLQRRATKGETDPLKALEKAFQLQVSFIAKYPSVPGRLLAWYAQTGDVRVRSRIEGCIAEYEARVFRLISQAQHQGLVSANIDVRAAATLFVGLLQGMALRTSVSLSRPEILLREAAIVFPAFINGLSTDTARPLLPIGQT